jgi:CRISPR/Cas system endoribonuclease Cas6 (RAMP superfamily)
MKINYHKSELMAINMEPLEVVPFLNIFQCVAKQFPVKYLGLPLYFNKLKREDLQPLEDSLLNKMAGCWGKLLSTEARKNSHPDYFI